MKIKYLFLISISIFTASLISCQKDFTIDNITNRPDSTVNPPVGMDSNYLDRIIYTENYNGTIRTYQKTFFNYDLLKRVITIYDTTFDDLSQVDAFYKIQFYYLSNNQLPFKSIKSLRGVSEFGYLQDTIYYTYNSSNQLLNDSTYSYSIATVNTNTLDTNRSLLKKYYQYQTNKLFSSQQKQIFYSSNNSQNFPYIENDTLTFDTNGNVINASNKKIYSNSQVDYRNGTFTYDNKYSPSKKLNIKFNFSAFLKIDVYSDLETYYLPSNNLLSSMSNGYTINLGGNPNNSGIYNGSQNNTNGFFYNANNFLDYHNNGPILGLPGVTLKTNIYYKNL